MSLSLSKRWLIGILGAFVLGQGPFSFASGHDFEKETFDTFADFRHRILGLIGGAKNRIILTTSYFTDGDIVSAIYLAKYRGLKVHVFLGPEKAGHYLSRLGYLKRQKVETFLTPEAFPVQEGSVLIVDKKLYTSSNSLDFRARAKAYEIKKPHKKEVIALVRSYQKALKNPQIAVAKPARKVGRKREAKRKYKRYYQKKVYSHSAGDGSYSYDGRGYKRPKDLPRSLPKETVMQKKERQLKEEQKDSEPSPSL